LTGAVESGAPLLLGCWDCWASDAGAKSLRNPRIPAKYQRNPSETPAKFKISIFNILKFKNKHEHVAIFELS